MNYTKGEWKVSKNLPLSSWVIVIEGNNLLERNTIANLYNNKDDALLMAAAPNMYEATKIALDLVKHVLYGHPYDAIAQVQKQIIEQALAKAEGK